jgi:DNA primase catalytic subunit
MMITMKAAFKESKLQSKLYQKHLKVTMANKVRRIKNYYRSITEDDIYLPPYSNFRQYRFFVWEPKSQRIVVKVLKDNVKTKKTLLSHLRRLAPINVYYTTGQWLNPQGIGPDPESRKGLAKMRKKGWCAKESKKVTLKRYHNTMLKRDLYFDIDYDNKDYHQGIQMASELIHAINKHIHCYEFKNIKQQIVFSGGKGFHLIINGYYDEAFASPSKSYLFKVLRREKIKQGQEKETLLRYSCNHENKNADIERHYKSVVTILKHETNLLLDWMVTYDNRRIIRLPGSVHGKSMRVCKEINFSDDNVIKNRAGRPVGYIPADPIP